VQVKFDNDAQLSMHRHLSLAAHAVNYFWFLITTLHQRSLGGVTLCSAHCE